MPKAEAALRQAYASGKADARVRQNLGLVVGLQGRFAEAESIVKADLPADVSLSVAMSAEEEKGVSPKARFESYRKDFLKKVRKASPDYSDGCRNA